MRFRDFSINIKIRLITSFFTRTISLATTPFLIIFLSNYVSKTLTGIILIISIVCSFISSILGGYLADLYNRKRMLLWGQALQIIGYLGLAGTIYAYEKILQNTFIIGALYLFFILQSIGSNLYKPAYNALVMDSTNSANREAVYKLNYWMMNLSLAIGSSLGGFFYKNYLIELILASAIITLIISIILQLYLDNHSQVYSKKSNNVFKGLSTQYAIAIKDIKWVMFVLGSALVFSAEFSLSNYTNVRLSQDFNVTILFNIPVDGILIFSILQILNTVLIVFFTFLIQNKIEKYDKTKNLIIGLSLYIVGYTVISYDNRMFILLAFMIIASIGELIFSPFWQSEQVALIPIDKRASYSAFGALSNTIATSIASFYLIISDYTLSLVTSLLILVFSSIGAVCIVFAIKKNAVINTKSSKGMSN